MVLSLRLAGCNPQNPPIHPNPQKSKDAKHQALNPSNLLDNKDNLQTLDPNPKTFTFKGLEELQILGMAFCSEYGPGEEVALRA